MPGDREQAVLGLSDCVAGPVCATLNEPLENWQLVWVVRGGGQFTSSSHGVHAVSGGLIGRVLGALESDQSAGNACTCPPDFALGVAAVE